jgi:hypothetical protein
MKFTTDFPFSGAKLQHFYENDYHFCFSFFAICNQQKTYAATQKPKEMKRNGNIQLQTEKPPK